MTCLPKIRARPRWRRALGFVAEEKRLIALIVAFTVLAGGLGALEPLVLKSVVDELLAGQRPRALVALVAGLLGLYVVKEVLAALSSWLTWRTRLRVQRNILEETVGRLHTLSIAYHRTQPVGSLLTRLDRGIQGLVSAFAELAFHTLPALVFLVMAAGLMLRLDWRLAACVFLFVPIPALIGAYAAPIQSRRERRLLERWMRIYGRFNEVLSGIITVKSFAMEHEEAQRFIRQVDEANQLVVRGVGFDSRMGALQNLFVCITRVVLIGWGGYLVWHGQVTVGTLLAFLGYVSGLFGPVQGLTNVYQTVRKAAVSLETIFEILDSEDQVFDAPDAMDLGNLRGEIELRNVWFGYQKDRFVLRGINMKVAAGQTVALVGSSGAGKTSLAVLLQRLYEQQEGEILIDGMDLRQVTQRSLRRQIGVVLQDASLFNDTVRANIAYGRPSASQADIEAAARAANAHEFILTLAGGYEAEVGERGGRLSGGQRQRIAIARAILRDPPIVILDEATSALDAESEAAVQEALGRLLEGRTTLVIAHRLSTIASADRIFVLRAGRIVEQGTHRDLVAAGGYYASMVAVHDRGLLAAGARPAVGTNA